MSQFLNIGFYSYVPVGRIIGLINLKHGVAPPHVTSAPIKRFMDLKDDSLLLDCTVGRQRKTMILLDSGQIILSSLSPETLVLRANGDKE